MPVAPGVIIDLGKLFENTFGGKPYVIESLGNGLDSDKLTSSLGSTLKEQIKGIDVWFPTRFFEAGGKIPVGYLPYSVVRVSGKKNIVKTPLIDWKGTAKEQYSVDDYAISLKGFVIGNNGEYPEAEIDSLKELFENRKALQIDNAITNVFLMDPFLEANEQKRVVIESLEFPEVEGGRINVKPFSMQLVSDHIFKLEVDVQDDR